MDLSAIFEQIRENANKEIWSRGVELARQDAVSGDSRTEDELILRVLERARGVSALITLWPEDLDWSKDCSCKIDPCHHVCAAIIALRRAEEQGVELPMAKTAGGIVRYAFRRQDGALWFERYVDHGGERKLLTVPLAHAGSEYAVSPTRLDQTIENALAGERRGKLSYGTMNRLLAPLTEAEVTLDGEIVAIHKEALGLTILIRDEGLGLHVQGQRDPRILENFHNGVVRTADGLHPQLDLSLEPEDRNALLHGRTIPLRDIERFVSEKLPEWEKRFPIIRRARNLPELVEADPALELKLERQGDQLLVLPGLIYGEPVLARIADGVFRPLGQKVPIRQPDEERRLKDQLWRSWGLELYHAKVLDTLDAIAFVEGLERWPNSIHGDGASQFKIHGALEPDVRWEAGRLELGFKSSKGQPPEGYLVLKAWQERRSLVPLLDGGFATLPQDWLNLYGAKIMDLLIAQQMREGLPKAAVTQALQLFDQIGMETPPDLAIFRRLLDGSFDERGADLPDDMQVELRPYQNEGVAWLQNLKELGLGALLADDMGLGKTVQAIACLSKRSLIIAPTSVLPNWKRELERFRPGLKVALYHGSNRTWSPDADVVLSSYGLLRQEPELFGSEDWAIAVLDEAQTIKNAESKIAQAAIGLRARFRLALSGTPVENRLEDLWSLFAFINPGLLGSKKEFRDRWARPIEDGDAHAAVRLRAIIRPFIKRRLKQDVAKDLPPRIEKILYSELWPEERRLYDAIQLSTRQELIDKLEAGGSVFEALEALLRMRQACCHPGLIPSQTAPASSKVTLLVETLETALAEGHKALVFSQWTSLLDLLEPQLEAAGIRFLRLDGSTRDRQSIVDQFQAEDGPPVLIMSLKAGGVGLNLTRADHVFILDPWWNPAAADQAADRAHRIGQDRPVIIHPMVALDSVEEKIMELQRAKHALADASLKEGDPEIALSVTREDILSLLRA